MPIWYLSFASENEFLGACLVEAADQLGAVRAAHALHVNPGGECLIIPTPAGITPPFPLNRLLSREELGEGASYGEIQKMGLTPPSGTAFVHERCNRDNKDQ